MVLRRKDVFRQNQNGNYNNLFHPSKPNVKPQIALCGLCNLYRKIHIVPDSSLEV